MVVLQCEIGCGSGGRYHFRIPYDNIGICDGRKDHLRRTWNRIWTYWVVLVLHEDLEDLSDHLAYQTAMAVQSVEDSTLVE